jgi:hypothetical protein
MNRTARLSRDFRVVRAAATLRAATGHRGKFDRGDFRRTRKGMP